MALLDALHPRHDEAMSLLERGPITVTPPTLTEVTRVIRRIANKRGHDGNVAAREAVRVLRNIPGYRLAAEPSEEAVAQAYDRDRSLSFADAWNLVVSVHGAERLATFDSKLQRAYGRKRERSEAP